MSNGFPPIADEPYKYENEFNYSVWVPNASVTVCNVPWDSSYRDVARFATEADKQAYFSALKAQGTTISLERMTILKYGEPVLINIPFNAVNRYNYLIVEAPIMPVPFARQSPDTYYYFIQSVEYRAPNTTQLNVLLDVWQTYYDLITFEQCYVERGHISIANENATFDNLARYQMLPEGMDYGNEYSIQGQFFYSLLDDAPMVVVVSTADLTADFGTVEAPNLRSASGGIYDDLPSGANVYAFTGANFTNLMGQLAGAPWVAQCITMLTVVPAPMLDLSTPATIQGIPGYTLAYSNTFDWSEIIIDNFFDRFDIPERYANLLKFYTSPYCMVEMTTLSGGEIVLKPECFSDFRPNSDHAVVFRMLSCVAPPHIKALFFPASYNGKPGSTLEQPYYTVSGNQRQSLLHEGEFTDLAVQIGNFPQFPLVNNQYLAYLASTAATRQYSFDTADWSQAKAQAGAALAYGQAGKAIDTSLAGNRANVQAMNDRTKLAQMSALAGGATGVVTGAAAGAISGGPAGAAVGIVGGAASAGAQMAIADAQNNINVNLANTQAALGARQANYNRDTNKDYAEFAAKGDYQNQIQAINAKVQDAKLTQPSTSGQNGGEAFNLANGMVGVLFRFKRIKEQHLRTIGEYWLRYGYYVNESLHPRLTFCVVRSSPIGRCYKRIFQRVKSLNSTKKQSGASLKRA